jgi:hypothetical protein
VVREEGIQGGQEQSGLDGDRSAADIGVDDPIHPGRVEQDAGPDRRTGEGGPRGTRRQWDLKVAADLEGGAHVRFVHGEDDRTGRDNTRARVR